MFQSFLALLTEQYLIFDELRWMRNGCSPDEEVPPTVKLNTSTIVLYSNVDKFYWMIHPS